MPNRSAPPESAAHSAPAGDEREVRYEHSRDLADLLAGLNASLLISTYQAGKLVAVGTRSGRLALSFHNFDRPMGVAVDPSGDSLAVAGKNSVWMLKNARDVAAQMEPASGAACYLARSSHVTGEIQAHELAWAGDQLLVVNTLFSCLASLHPSYSFVPQWRPPFVSALAAEDRCHLNGLAMQDGRPKYVTAMAESDTAGGWRADKVKTGCLIDVASGEIVARGFAMPHSPTIHNGHIWLLDSGRGALVRVDPAGGSIDTVARFPGYTRGLAMIDNMAFVGLSKIRETSTFGGVPIAENRNRLKCGVGVVNVASGELVGQFEFTTGVEEIFDVTLLAGVTMPTLRGPYANEDGENTIWTVPK